VLLKTAAQAVRELVADLYPDVRIGLVYTVHTFGRDLGFKPHVHLVEFRRYRAGLGVQG
jgi:hypothetical protein